MVYRAQHCTQHGTRPKYVSNNRAARQQHCAPGIDADGSSVCPVVYPVGKKELTQREGVLIVDCEADLIHHRAGDVVREVERDAAVPHLHRPRAARSETGLYIGTADIRMYGQACPFVLFSRPAFGAEGRSDRAAVVRMSIAHVRTHACHIAVCEGEV